MRALCTIVFLLLILFSFEKKKAIDQFGEDEIEDISNKIGVALTQNKPELLADLIGLSQIMDSAIFLAKTDGLSEYQIKQLGLDNPRNYNDGLKKTLDWICHFSSMDGNVVLSSKTVAHEKVTLTYVYSNPINIFEILEFELITNGYQLFIGDINMVHRDTKLSEWIMTNILSPGYAENISEMTKTLEKAYNEGIKKQWDRAEYFFNSVPYEYLIDPMVLEYSIPVTYILDTSINQQIFNDAIDSYDDYRAKLYWKIRRESFFERNDSMGLYIGEIEARIGQNRITQSMLKN